jgi:hypothetical protein
MFAADSIRMLQDLDDLLGRILIGFTVSSFEDDSNYLAGVDS